MEKQMEMDKAQFAEQLKNLVELGKKKKNVLEYQEINDFFKGITLNNEQMDLIFEYLEANGVDVLRVTEDDALLDNEDMHMEEDEVDLENIDLSVPEGVSIEDPVRMYLKEIGKVPSECRRGNRTGKTDGKRRSGGEKTSGRSQSSSGGQHRKTICGTRHVVPGSDSGGKSGSDQSSGKI